MNSYLAMFYKEIRHIGRDWQTLGIIIALPVLMLLMFGFALSADLKEVPIQAEIPQYDKSAVKIVCGLDGGSLFQLDQIHTSYRDLDSVFAHSPRPKAILRFPVDFRACLVKASCPVQIWIDASDPNTAMLLSQSLGLALQDESRKILGLAKPELVLIETRFLFNPEQKSSLYFVPGLMATLLIMVCALLTSVTLVREKENGTLEQLKMSPIHPLALVLGKLSPYIIIAMLIASLILAMGYFVFGLMIQGSWLFLVGVSLIYVYCALAIGVLISALVNKQQHAMLIALAGTMLPSIILSGFIFPVASMPLFLQVLSKIIPATWYLLIVRGVVLQGSGWAELWSESLILFLMGSFLLIVAMRKIKGQLQ